jgi:hypothetical protein
MFERAPSDIFLHLLPILSRPFPSLSQLDRIIAKPPCTGENG